MKIGVCLPYMKRGLNRQTFQDWCRIIDQGPFSSLSCGERVTGYSMEMRNILAFAAASTERVRIIPSLYVLPPSAQKRGRGDRTCASAGLCQARPDDRRHGLVYR